MTINPEEKKKVLSYRWIIFIVLAIAYFFVYFHRTTGGAISDLMRDSFGAGAPVALLASAYLYAYTLMQLPSGILTDKFGPRKAASVFIILLALGSVLCAVAEPMNNFNVMIAGKFVIGIGAAVIYIPIMKVLAVWYRKGEFATMSGILLLVGNVGGIAAATPMFVMMDSLGIANTYYILAVITAIIGIMTYVLVRNHPKEMDLPSIEEIVSEETGEPITESTSEQVPMVQALKMTFTSGMKFWPLAIWFFCIYGTIMLWQASLAGTYYQNVAEFEPMTSSMFVTMVGVGMVVGCPLAGVLSDRVLKSRKKVIIVGTVMYTIIWAVIWLTAGSGILQNAIAQYAINFLFGFFGGFFVVSYAQIKELFPVGMAGTSTAALNLFPFAGGAILITISGFLIKHNTELAEYETVWMMAFVLMVIGCICAFLSKEKARN